MTAAPDAESGAAPGSPPVHHSQYGGQPKTAWDFRFVVWNFTLRDLKVRYRSAALGWTWSLLVPLATVLIYSLVFSVFWRSTPPPMGNGEQGIYAVWFFVGLTAWIFFAGTVPRGMQSLIGAGPMMHKIFLPGYVPVLGTVGAICVEFGIQLGIVVVLLTVLGNASVVWLVLPLWLVIYVPFVASVALVVAVLNVFVRDLTLMIGVLIQLLFFLTPIIYPITQVPESLGGIPIRAIVGANPMAQFVLMIRQILYAHEVPSLGQFGYVAAWTVALLGLAVWLFRRYGRRLGELI